MPNQSEELVMARKKSSACDYYSPKDILLNNIKYRIREEPSVRSPRESASPRESGSPKEPGGQFIDIITRRRVPD